jgi:2'-5' RNA ligase
MARLRTFIAVDVGKSIRDRCVALQETLARSGAEIKWVEPENIHVSLLFLGEVNEREIHDLCVAVGDCCAEVEAFQMSVETVGCFPNPRRPRVVWAGIGAGKHELVALHDALEGPLLELGCYRREERSYTPHVTLGRVKADSAPDRLGTAIARQSGWQGGVVDVREVHVLSSELRPSGPLYTVLSRAKLQPSAQSREQE